MDSLKSLAADYDSSSDEESSHSSTSKKTIDTNRLVPATEMLNEPSKVVPHSVFSNPYKDIEAYESSVLEKHVKMTVCKEVINAKIKPCYKFYKGKCRFGEACKFSHSNTNQNTVSAIEDNDDQNDNSKVKTKKRSGLKNDLVPPKKFMKTYNKLK